MIVKKKTLWPLYILLAIIPIIATLLLLSTQLKTSLFDFHPAWTDEVLYWQQISSFAKVGFQNGYFTFDEELANSGIIQYGTHGPVFTVLYGLLARLTGWELFTGIIINLAILFISILGLFFLLRPNGWQSCFILLLVGLSYPVLYFIPTLMQESLHYSLMIFLAGLVVRLINDEKKQLPIKIAALLIVTLGSLMKISWVVLYFPVIYFFKEKRTFKWFLISIAISLISSLLVYWLFSFWTSPYPDWYFMSLVDSSVSFQSRIGLLIKHALENLKNYFSFSEPTQKIEIIFRFQFIFLLFLFAILLRKRRPLMITGSFLLLSNWLIVVFLYDVSRFRDYRFLSPFLLFGLVILIMQMQFGGNKVKFTLLLILISNIFSIGIFTKYYQFTHANEFGENWDPVGNTYIETIASIQYTQGVDPWCNTLLSTYISGENFKQMEPGIGLSVAMYPDNMKGIIRSRYIFVPKQWIGEWGLTDSCEVMYEDDTNVICKRIIEQCQNAN